MGNVSSAVEGFFTDLKTLLQVVAPIFAFLGVVGLGLASSAVYCSLSSTSKAATDIVPTESGGTVLKVR